MSLLEEFIANYLQCALWSSQGEDDSGFMDGDSPLDINDESYNLMVEDATRFFNQYYPMIENLKTYNIPQFGHDFWLTRNGHGAGFWDRTDMLPRSIRDLLTEASEKAGGIMVFIQDEEIYFELEK